ncbi:hypothetical protein [Streptomyces carpinensis]|uniref:hypothetical protein n=1 Tax=Streptomyces carpinensis TaxID=66369 RepID=UPI000A389783|nr:hypothetical protein [Streptomyces carpinensis]
MLWTTRYIGAAVTALRALPADQREHDILGEDVAGLSRLKHGNLNCPGRYGFRVGVPVGGWLRPLRDPAATDVDGDGAAAAEPSAGVRVDSVYSRLVKVARGWKRPRRRCRVLRNDDQQLVTLLRENSGFGG